MVRRCSCDLTWLSRPRFDLRACFEPALAIHNDTVVGRESFRDDCDILIDRPGVDVARLGDVVGLDHPNVKSLRSTLQRDGGDRQGVLACVDQRADPYEFTGPEPLILI